MHKVLHSFFDVCVCANNCTLLHRVLLCIAQSIVHNIAHCTDVLRVFCILHMFVWILHIFVHVYCILNIICKNVLFYCTYLFLCIAHEDSLRNWEVAEQLYI